ncbi:protein takeout-like [Arctopsyche grandis]|uniref:protein takeout-like n=1 Tax=Arctopsyche grandis TaxID=121162 RepID=UPI00406DA292
MNFNVLPLVALLFILDRSYAYYEQKPDFIKTCYKKDPKFGECSRVAVQGIFDKLKEGLPEIGIDPLDPLKISKIRILQGDGPVNVNAALDDVTVTGFGATQVLVSEVYDKTYDFFTRIRIPHLRIEGTYNLRGKILLLPLVGRGTCWFEPTNLDIDILSDVTPYTKDKFVFFNVTDAHVKFNIGGLSLRMNNLFDGIKSLEESTNSYLNANWRPVADSLRPILARTIEDILVVILQKIFHNLPANYLIADVKIHKDA